MGGVFNTVNLHLYHYAGNNPIKYTAPDGRFDICDFYIPDFCKVIKSTESKLAVPLGGGLSSTQKDIAKIQGLMTLGFSQIPDLGSFTSILGADFSVDSALSLIETLVGVISETAGGAFAFVDLLTTIASDPSVSSTNYTNTQKEFLAQCAVEQAFVKDYSKALSKHGILNTKTTNGSFILNLEIRNVPLFSDVLFRIANDVKDSNPLYKDVEINQ